MTEQPAGGSLGSELGVVLVRGTGLVGTSVGLGLAARRAEVLLHDPSPTVQALAADLGAGRPWRPGDAAGAAGRDDPGQGDPGPSLVVVAAPPDVVADVVVDSLDRFPRAVVTDVASVKAAIVTEVARRAGDAAQRYVGGHPLAGRERSGPVLARGDLFTGRPWVLTPVDGTGTTALRRAWELASTLGAQVVEMPPAAHDEAVALVSHLPQVLASLVAARLVGAEARQTSLAGQGLRDVTRIAEGDPVLWAQILSSNAAPLARLLADLRDDLDGAVAALHALAGTEHHPSAAPGPGRPPGPRAVLAGLVARGNAGRELLPGRHGGSQEALAGVQVLVPDVPGELARLLATIGEARINLEDLRLEHALGQPLGVAVVSVLPSAREPLVSVLQGEGWSVVE